MPRRCTPLALPLAVALGLGLGWGTPGAAAEPDASSEEGSAASERKWITHRVVPKETYESIGKRYGVTREEIIKWNRKKLGKKKWIYAKQKLRIHARIHAPPREKIFYEIKKGDTWNKIAKRFGVPVSHVKAWNPETKKKGLYAGRSLKIYTDPKAPARPASSAGSGAGGSTESIVSAGPLPEVKVRSGGIGVGAPNRGHLVNGVRLPDSDMVKVFDRDKVYGTSHAIKHLLIAIATFRRDTGYDKPLTISSISLKKGGRFRPHSSHRTGRDVDIRLPRKPGSKKGEAPSSIDWSKTWALVKALIDTGEVEYIFVSWSRQKYLYRAAQSAGATKAELAALIQYPKKPKERTRAKVRHSPGHTVHLHVRFTCTPGNSRCKTY